MTKEYPYIVREVNHDKEGVNYIIEFIDFPGLIGGGDTVQEAKEVADEALELTLKYLSEEGKDIPSPTDFNSTGRITLRIPKSLHVRTIEMAKREDVSLNTYINDALANKVYQREVYDTLELKISDDIKNTIKKYIPENIQFDKRDVDARVIYDFGKNQFFNDTDKIEETNQGFKKAGKKYVYKS